MPFPHFGFGRPAAQMPTGGLVYTPRGADPSAMSPPVQMQPQSGYPGLSVAPPSWQVSGGDPQAAPAAIASGGAPISPLAILQEQFASGDGLLGYHHAHQRLLMEQQNQAYAARDAQMQDAAIKALGTGPDADKQAYALHHDPASFATSTNKVQEPEAVAAGASAGAGGHFGFTAPDPVGLENAHAKAAEVANGAVSAGASAEQARLEGLRTPSMIQKNSSEAVAALINARRVRTGAAGPGIAPPPGWH